MTCHCGFQIYPCYFLLSKHHFLNDDHNGIAESLMFTAPILNEEWSICGFITPRSAE